LSLRPVPQAGRGFLFFIPFLRDMAYTSGITGDWRRGNVTEHQRGHPAGECIFPACRRWMLITAGRDGRYNTMTASWGGMGVLWGRNVATIYVRPQRLYPGIHRTERILYTVLFWGAVSSAAQALRLKKRSGHR
jgi:hypothetical protein